MQCDANSCAGSHSKAYDCPVLSGQPPRMMGLGLHLSSCGEDVPPSLTSRTSNACNLLATSSMRLLVAAFSAFLFSLSPL